MCQSVWGKKKVFYFYLYFMDCESTEMLVSCCGVLSAPDPPLPAVNLVQKYIYLRNATCYKWILLRYRIVWLGKYVWLKAILESALICRRFLA